jgi:uncharacterized protein
MHAMDDVTERLRTAAPGAFAGTPVVFAYLFGSQVRGRARARSDVDVAVFCAPLPGPDERLDLQLDLARRLEEGAGVGPVEVVLLQKATPRFLKAILGNRIVIHSRDEPRRVRWESRAAREALDFALHADRLDRELLRATAEGQR